MRTYSLGEACAELGITRPILRKYLARLEVLPARHDVDQRFWLLTEEVVAQIREMRARRPLVHALAPRAYPVPAPSAATTAPQPAAYAAAFTWPTAGNAPTDADSDHFTDTSNMISGVAAASRTTRKLVRDHHLPDGLVLAKHVAIMHHVPWRTVRRYLDGGRIPYLPERQFQLSNGVWAKYVLDAGGLAAFYRICTTDWAQREEFRACPACPHTPMGDPF